MTPRCSFVASVECPQTSISDLTQPSIEPRSGFAMHSRRLGRAQRARLKSSSLARTREGHPVGGGNFATSQKPFIVFEEVKSEEAFVLRQVELVNSVVKSYIVIIDSNKLFQNTNLPTRGVE